MLSIPTPISIYGVLSIGELLFISGKRSSSRLLAGLFESFSLPYNPRNEKASRSFRYLISGKRLKIAPLAQYVISHDRYRSFINSIGLISTNDSGCMVYDRLAFGSIRSGNATLLHILPPFNIISVYPNADSQNLFFFFFSVLIVQYLLL